MNRWLALVIATALALAAIVVILLLGGGRTPPPQPVPPTVTPSDPLAWYKSLPTATGCPKSVPAGLKPFYSNCPDTQEEDPE
jgi:hypothetical protein